MIKLSICMIVKNEANILDECLSHIQGLADELIIVDTGSNDGTKEIAYRYTSKVYEYKWCNDFSAARNFSISKASNDYILVLDADEILVKYDYKNLNQVSMQDLRVGRMKRINEYSRNGIPYKFIERVGRLFNRNYYQYEGIIHEQLVPKEDINVAYYDIPLEVVHSGYEGDLESRKIKTNRNITLLFRALENNPEDPYLLYQIGKSYYMEEKYNLACEYLSEALTYDLDTKLEYVQDAVESYGYSLINSNQYDTAMQLLNIYDEFAHNPDFVFMIAMVLMNHGDFEEAIAEFLKVTKLTGAKMEGVTSYLAYYNIGVIYECTEYKNIAKEYYMKAGDYTLAKKRLEVIE